MSGSPPTSNFSEHPLVVLAAAFAAGVLLARLAHAPPSACVTLAALTSALAFFAAFKRKEAAARLVVLAFACAGAVLSSVELKDSSGETRLRGLYESGRIAPGEPVELTGVLERAPEIAPDGLLLSLRVEAARHKSVETSCGGRVELFAPVRDARAAVSYDSLELRRGARVRVAAVLTREEKYRNPGARPFGEYLDVRDVDARGTLKSALLVERLDDETVFVPLALLDGWRAALVRKADASFSKDAAGVFKAAVLGNRFGLSREAAERFREGGTIHALVISGLHIAFLGGLVWAAARRLTRRPFARWAASVACVWAYTFGVGAEASVVRAALTFTLAALAPALGRRSGALNATGGAALVLLAWRPSNLLDPSFQLTFLSVLAVLAFALPLLANFKAVGEWRPTRATPYPPACPAWLRALAETLYWRERAWRRETARASHSYELFKTPPASKLERWRLQPALRFASAAVLTTAAVQIVLLPPQAVYFHRLSLASLVLNLFAGALLVAHAFAALAALALSGLSATLAAPFIRLTEFSTYLLIHGVDPFARAGVAAFRLPTYTGAASSVYALHYAPLLLLARASLRWRPLAGPPRSRTGPRRARLLKGAGCVSAATAFVIVAHPLSAPRADGRLRVDFIDVGQGDSALVTMPDGSTLLVDGGGRPGFRAPRDDEDEAEEFEPDSRGVGEAAVSEYLWWRGLSRLDYVLATHADADHIDGLNDVLKSFDPRAALVGRTPPFDEEFARFSQTAREEGVPVSVVARGDRLRFGAVEVEVLWPSPAGNAGSKGATSANDDSVVLRLRYGRRTFLLTGDIESRTEHALLSAGDDLRADALKVAHHGSRTSSTDAFVAATRPAFAVVSVARNSPYGHPHAEVLARWRDAGAQILTTAERGMVTVSTDGEDLKVETFVRP
ncbi:MAG: ComEC/Rec2 family competence protein [Acidobacteria bacterium]|nr:ComEC/Rec2 family competence protein [Acidobacteriota bacterium]